MSSSRSSRSNSNDRGQVQRYSKPRAPRSCKLFVTNIDSKYTEEELRKELNATFFKYGDIRQIVIKTKQGSLNSYAFVEYHSIEDADQARRAMNRTQFLGKDLKVEFGRGINNNRSSLYCTICRKDGHSSRNCYHNKGQYRRRASRSDSRQDERRKYRRSRSVSDEKRRQVQRRGDKDREYERRRSRSSSLRKEKERQSFRQRERQRERDRQRQRDRERQRERERQRQRERQRERDKERQLQKDRDRERDVRYERDRYRTEKYEPPRRRYERERSSDRYDR